MKMPLPEMQFTLKGIPGLELPDFVRVATLFGREVPVDLDPYGERVQTALNRLFPDFPGGAIEVEQYGDSHRYRFLSPLGPARQVYPSDDGEHLLVQGAALALYRFPKGVPEALRVFPELPEELLDVLLEGTEHYDIEAVEVSAPGRYEVFGEDPARGSRTHAVFSQCFRDRTPPQALYQFPPRAVV